MALGCLMCNNLYIYGYFNTTRRCPFCYLLAASHFVFESLVQLFRSHAMKTVVLGGSSSPQTISVPQNKCGPYGLPMQPNVYGMQKQFGSSLYSPIEHAKGEMGRGNVAKPKAPRKTVSINHTVEYIDDYLHNNKRKRKAMEQWPSMEIDDDEIKPLRSILKVVKKHIR